MNTFRKLRLKRPRTWAVLMFTPLVLVTVVALPLAVAYEFVCEVPCLAYNLWQDIRTFFQDVLFDCTGTIRDAWTGWWQAVHNKKEDDNGQE